MGSENLTHILSFYDVLSSIERATIYEFLNLCRGKSYCGLFYAHL